MLKNIELVLPRQILSHIGFVAVKFKWNDDPPDSGETIDDAVLVTPHGKEEPLANYGYQIHIYDGSDPSTREQHPYPIVFEMTALLTNQCFQTWEIYKRPTSPTIRIEAENSPLAY